MLNARFLFVTFVLICLASTGAVAQSRQADSSNLDEEGERSAILKAIKSAIATEDFAKLTAMEAEFRISRARTQSGVWKLAVFHAGVQAYLADGLLPESDCQYSKSQFVNAWKAASSGSPAPVITDAALLLTQAWCIRGGGYAIDVAPAAWRQFKVIVTSATKVLDRHSTMASVDPEFYAIKLKALRSEGSETSQFESVLDEATAREPYYHRTYFNAVWSYLPQWGGSFDQVERFAEYSAGKTKSEEGSGVYARVFWSLDECNCDIMAQSADWSKLRQAMRDIYARYPAAWNGNYFANVSCRMGQGEEGRRYLRAVHPEVLADEGFAALFANCDSIVKPN
jgi:hypothetical protein